MFTKKHAANGTGVQNSSKTVAAPGSVAPSFTMLPPGVAEGVNNGIIEPEFIAMPSPGKVCPYSGLQRGMLYALLNAGAIRSVTLRRPGTTRGRRLIVLASLKSYLRSLDAEQNGGKGVM